MKGAVRMIDNNSKQENVLQLQQLVLHLQSELNKYKTSHPSSKSETEYEQDRLFQSNKELLYKSNKQQRMIELYKKQINNLTRQRDEALNVTHHLKQMQELRSVENDQLTETLILFREDIITEIRNALTEQKQKALEITENLISLNKEQNSFLETHIKELAYDPKKEENQNIIRRQHELITLLEEYFIQLSKIKKL
ncbi:hypothetical protein NCCP2716_14490 [Sporosarcina sp. NCCP-2716]|uniref:hypothetical protein n=1 Tax=Sporosarcina sp. NCCP-2716 TaxID=2943679 RepID=UPI00203B5122|nr:hypothetical protein [Sporosarcina sp. NCCP-2716]GKV68951.1 hypothetical protein NCCP2716_14490 [Sporosarcina sp. NCCP-2716]